MISVGVRGGYSLFFVANALKLRPGLLASWHCWKWVWSTVNNFSSFWTPLCSVSLRCRLYNVSILDLPTVWVAWWPALAARQTPVTAIGWCQRFTVNVGHPEGYFKGTVNWLVPGNCLLSRQMQNGFVTLLLFGTISRCYFWRFGKWDDWSLTSHQFGSSWMEAVNLCRPSSARSVSSLTLLGGSMRIKDELQVTVKALSFQNRFFRLVREVVLVCLRLALFHWRCCNICRLLQSLAKRMAPCSN